MESEAMRARRCEGGEAMLRGEARRGEGEQCDASDARRAALGELRRGVAMRVRRCEPMSRSLPEESPVRVARVSSEPMRISRDPAHHVAAWLAGWHRTVSAVPT